MKVATYGAGDMIKLSFFGDESCLGVCKVGATYWVAT